MIKNNIYIIAGITLFLILALLTLLQTQIPFWDEAYYLENVTILNNLGFSKQYLIDYKGPAGPTFALIHCILQPITGLKVPLVRMVNIIFLAGILYFLYRIFTSLKNSKTNSIIFSISSLAIVTIYTISGLVLTEIFAVFFLTLTLFYVVKYYQQNRNNYWVAILSGLSFSLAVLGRQPIIVLWFALPFLFLEKNKLFKFDFSKKEFLKFITVTVFISMVLPFCVFYVWGNIQPASEAFTGIGLSLKNLILAFGYAALFSVFVNPNYFSIKNDFSNKWELLMVFSISIIVNIIFLKITFAPFKSIALAKLPASLFYYYELFCGSILSVLGLSFVYFTLKKNLNKRDNLTVFFVISFFLIIGTSLKVTHQFSARYVAQAFPLLILMLHSRKQNITWSSILFLVIGGILGLFSLNSYF